MGNRLFALLTILVMAVSLVVGCQTVPKKTEPTTLEISPTNAEDYNNRGIAYYSKGQFDLAIADFNKALEINPRYAEAYNNRGSAYDSKGQFDQAIADFNKALEINPRYANAYYNRGIAYRRRGQFDQAIADFNKALEINPKFLEDLSKASGRER